MRILLISGSFPPMKCGVGDYTALLAKALARHKGAAVAILTDFAASVTVPNQEFEVFPIARGWKISDAARIISTVRLWHPDVVHIQYPGQAYGRRILPWLLPTLFQLMNVPVVQTWHEYYPRGSRRNLPNAILPGGLVVVRPNYTAIMPSWYRWLIRRKCLRYIPNASTIPSVRLTDTERSSIHARYAPTPGYLVAFFGFVYPSKGVEFLFEIADPATHRLVLICDLDSGDPYHKVILDHIRRQPWEGKVSITGFLPAEEAARLLGAADAVVFPFRDGGGTWNTSVYGALAQGTFVLTTSRDELGYVSSENIYYARPGDVADMRRALSSYIGQKKAQKDTSRYSNWGSIADAHSRLYYDLLD